MSDQQPAPLAVVPVAAPAYTLADLAALDALRAAGTQGDWVAECPGGDRPLRSCHDVYRCVIAGGDSIGRFDDGLGGGRDLPMQANADLACAAVNALAGLTAELRRLYDLADECRRWRLIFAARSRGFHDRIAGVPRAACPFTGDQAALEGGNWLVGWSQCTDTLEAAARAAAVAERDALCAALAALLGRVGRTPQSEEVLTAVTNLTTEQLDEMERHLALEEALLEALPDAVVAALAAGEVSTNAEAERLRQSCPVPLRIRLARAVVQLRAVVAATAAVGGTEAEAAALRGAVYGSTPNAPDAAVPPGGGLYRDATRVIRDLRAQGLRNHDEYTEAMAGMAARLAACAAATAATWLVEKVAPSTGALLEVVAGFRTEDAAHAHADTLPLTDAADYRVRRLEVGG